MLLKICQIDRSIWANCQDTKSCGVIVNEAIIHSLLLPCSACTSYKSYSYSNQMKYNITDVATYVHGYIICSYIHNYTIQCQYTTKNIETSSRVVRRMNLDINTVQ